MDLPWFRCCIPECNYTNNMYLGNDRKLFSFPKDLTLRQKWVDSYYRPELIPSNKMLFICSSHFTMDCLTPKGFLIRSEEFTPTLFLNGEENPENSMEPGKISELRLNASQTQIPEWKKRIRCAVKACQATGRKNPERKFFNVPSNKELRLKWQKAAEISDTDIKKKLYLCSIHFKNKNFTKSGFLKVDTIPSKYIHCTESEEESIEDEETENDEEEFDYNEEGLPIEVFTTSSYVPPSNSNGPWFNCCIPLCNYVNSTNLGDFRKLFSFPKDPVLRQKWYDVCFPRRRIPDKKLFICSSHFTLDCLTKKGFLLRTEEIMPTLFLNSGRQIKARNIEELKKKSYENEIPEWKTRMKCAIRDCDASGRRHPERRFLQVPTNKELRLKWQKAGKISDSDIKKTIYVCSIHFKKSCFTKSGIRFPDAIPTKFLPKKVQETVLETNVKLVNEPLEIESEELMENEIDIEGKSMDEYKVEPMVNTFVIKEEIMDEDKVEPIELVIKEEPVAKVEHIKTEVVIKEEPMDEDKVEPIKNSFVIKSQISRTTLVSTSPPPLRAFSPPPLAKLTPSPSSLTATLPLRSLSPPPLVPLSTSTVRKEGVIVVSPDEIYIVSELS
ncbi:hypothetical protein ACFFRR_008718 [Megaselia abdita]